MVAGGQPTSGLVTFRAVVHHEHEYFIQILMLEPVPSLFRVIPEVINLADPVGKDSISLNEIVRINRSIFAECQRPIFKFWYQRSPGAANVMSNGPNDWSCQVIRKTYLTILTRQPGLICISFSSALRYRSIIWGPLLNVTSDHISISLSSKGASLPTVVCSFSGPFDEKRIV